MALSGSVAMAIEADPLGPLSSVPNNDDKTMRLTPHGAFDACEPQSLPGLLLV